MTEQQKDPTPEEIQVMAAAIRKRNMEQMRQKKSIDRKVVGLRQVDYRRRNGRQHVDSE